MSLLSVAASDILLRFVARPEVLPDDPLPLLLGDGWTTLTVGVVVAGLLVVVR